MYFGLQNYNYLRIKAACILCKTLSKKIKLPNVCMKIIRTFGTFKKRLKNAGNLYK